MRKLIIILSLLLLPAVAAAQTTVPGSGGGGAASGSAVSGCTAYSLVYIDSAGNLACALAPVNGNVSTAGRGIFSVLDTITGASANSNFMSITGTQVSSLSAAHNSVLFSTTTGGSSAQPIRGVFGEMLAGYTGTNRVSGARFDNAAASTGALSGFITGTAGTVGIEGRASAGAAAVGVAGIASGGTDAIGVFGAATSGTRNVGGFFNLGGNATAPATSMGLAVDNNSFAVPIATFFDNSTARSTTAAAANVTIQDGAQVYLGPMGLTSATMTPTIVSEARSVVHSYAWTNAMVVALGATGTGDITVATLPAKTLVRNAYVVIDTPDSSANALTVGCGDAIGGAPFVNYVVASDAKAASNTVYGDAVAERGTSIDVEFYYMPSYTATTLVTCRFIKSVTNLNTVTGSTGRVILETVLIP